MTLFHPLCGAQLRGKPGARCRRAPVKGKTRCALHGGLSTGSTSPEGRAATAAGRGAWAAKTRARIARGEADKFPTGRKPRDPASAVRRKLRTEALRVAPESDAAQDRFIDPAPRPRRTYANDRPPWHPGGGSVEADALERLERTWITQVNDPRCDVPAGELDAAFDRIMAYEQAVGGEGSQARVVRLKWEWNDWRLRLATAESVRQVAVARAAAGPGPEPEPQLPAAAAVPAGGARLSTPHPPARMPDQVEVCSPARDDDELAIAAAIHELEQRLMEFNLAASSRTLLDRELAGANSPHERLAVLTRWADQAQRACDTAAALTERWQAVEREPAPVHDSPRTAAPWLHGR